jgi:hypothetical protein
MIDTLRWLPSGLIKTRASIGITLFLVAGIFHWYKKWGDDEADSSTVVNHRSFSHYVTYMMLFGNIDYIPSVELIQAEVPDMDEDNMDAIDDGVTECSDTSEFTCDDNDDNELYSRNSSWDILNSFEESDNFDEMAEFTH